MDNNNGSDDRDRWARLRFAVVGPLLASPPPAGQLRSELERLSQRDWEHPSGQGPVRFAVSTIERWHYAARAADRDPVKALRQQPRADAGRERAMSAALIEALRDQYRAHPSWSAQLHYEKRKGKKLSNTDWVSKSDPEARIAKMKDGTTHLAYKPEHAVDLDTGAVVAAELHPADEGDTTTLSKTLAKAEANLEAVDAAPTSEDPAECVADKGYHSRAVLRALNDSPWKTRIAAPKQTGFSRWHGDEAARRAVTNNRARLKSGVAREAFKLRAEIVERCFAHNLDRGGMRRTWLRGRENVHKRYLLHVAGHNLSLLMRQLIGAGTPREAVAGGYGGIFVLLTPTAVMPVALAVSQSGQTAFAAAFLIWE